MDWFTMGMALMGGLAIFLFGMEQMSHSLRTVAGDSMKGILAKLTNSRILGLLTGAGVTAVIQSSSVTTVMLVGFTTAGLMSLSQAVGVILGADIGTTITAQIVAFKVTKYALLLVAGGFLVSFATKNRKVKEYGLLVMGLGMIFFGMGVMSEGMYPLRSYEPFVTLMQSVSNPFIGIAVATAFTALVQSSSATMGVIIALSLQGLISLEAGIALALGANIGTCATAGLAAIGKPREAVRVAMAHVMFKVLGVALLLPFIPELASFVVSISPADPSLSGAERLAYETPRQIANAHTIFNVGLAVVFLPFTNQFAAMIERMVPLVAEEVAFKPLPLGLVGTPSLALASVRARLDEMLAYTSSMFDDATTSLFRGDVRGVEHAADRDDRVDDYYIDVVRYLQRIAEGELSSEQSSEVGTLLTVANDIEAIGDIVEQDAVSFAEQMSAAGLSMSTATYVAFCLLRDSVKNAMTRARGALAAEEEGLREDMALSVIGIKAEVAESAEAIELHLKERLMADEPKRRATYSVEVEILEKMKRCFYFAKRIAKSQLPE